MTKKMIKIIAVILMAVLMVSIASTVANATTAGWESVSIDMYKGKGDNSTASTDIGNFIGALLTVIQVVGMGVAIIMLIALAIKYISAAPGDKADIKKHAVVYVVGAITLFAASGIVQIIKNFAVNVSATGNGGTNAGTNAGTGN